MNLHKEKFTHLIPYLSGEFLKPGLLPTPNDERDLKTEHLLGFGLWHYTPANQSVYLPPISIKNQNGFNTCQFNATVGRKERDEKVELLVRPFVAYAAHNGLLTGNGFSDMRAGEKILASWGCPEKDFCASLGINEFQPNGAAYSWADYINVPLDKLTENAAKHKSKSYWSVSTVWDAVKLLDQGKASKVAIDWYSGDNIGYGFNAPWLIQKNIGYYIGGHCIVLDGYDMNYQYFSATKLQNSFGASWADAGQFHITFDMMNTWISKYGAWVDLDIEYQPTLSAQDIIQKFDDQNVKGDQGPAIYKIYQGYKLPYANAEAFLSINGFPYTKKGAFTIVPHASLELVPNYGNGACLDGSLGNYHALVELLKKPVNNNFNV